MIVHINRISIVMSVLQPPLNSQRSVTMYRNAFTISPILFYFRFFLPPRMAPRTIAPTLRSSPAREVGMPVERANFCFAAVMPTARFNEKETV